MPTYAIGDIQGCYDKLQCLLGLIEFNPSNDKLWLTGDLVNRGPQSLQTLRYVKSLGSAAITVLGNHDLHLLALATKVGSLPSNYTLDEILAAPDCNELCEWLRQRPLLHYDDHLKYVLVHAGLPPQWDLALAQHCAAEVEAVLQGPHYREFFRHMYGNRPNQWHKELTGWARLRYIVNALTRLRFCDRQGALDFTNKGAVGSQPPDLLPWFKLPQRANKGLPILFGHWAALGSNRERDVNESGIFALDSGCVWGNCLTALRLEDQKWFSVPCNEPAPKRQQTSRHHS